MPRSTRTFTTQDNSNVDIDIEIRISIKKFVEISQILKTLAGTTIKAWARIFKKFFSEPRFTYSVKISAFFQKFTTLIGLLIFFANNVTL